MKICPVGDDLFHADGRTDDKKDRHDETKGRNFAKVPKNMPRQEKTTHFHFSPGQTALPVHRLAWGMDNDGMIGSFLEGERNFSFLRNVQTRSVLHPVSYRWVP